MSFHRIVLFLIFALPTAASGQSFTGCFDFRGIPVATYMDPQLNDAAFATLAANGAPVILVNPAVMSRFSPLTQQWVYFHECGHHALAHVIRNIPFAQEQEADCFGIITFVQQGATHAAVQQVQWELSRLGPGDRTHLPGPARAFNLPYCLASAGIIPPPY